MRGREQVGLYLAARSQQKRCPNKAGLLGRVTPSGLDVVKASASSAARTD